MTPVETTAPYRIPAGDGLANIWWKTGRMTVKVGAAETGNAFSQIETDDPRGGATPLHVHHNEDETFYVLEGEITVLVDGERIDLAASDFAFAPRGIPHAYIVTSDRARMLTTLSPGGLEELFVELGTPVLGTEPPATAALPPMPELARAFAGYGCEVLGPPPSLADLS
ncbi:MAG TPA: quercetin 2,3-dioxygenase [Gaiellaceae bacterium]|jgi:quercetin dioxygenase-like cupin family protein|nr:quercetin 2,3-dioxygenase [Gaiellaceae bacterium]